MEKNSSTESACTFGLNQRTACGRRQKTWLAYRRSPPLDQVSVLAASDERGCVVKGVVRGGAHGDIGEEAKVAPRRDGGGDDVGRSPPA